MLSKKKEKDFGLAMGLRLAHALGALLKSRKKKHVMYAR